jgi:hypothetical protein
VRDRERKKERHTYRDRDREQRHTEKDMEKERHGERLQEVKVERFHRGVIAMESGAGWGEL